MIYADLYSLCFAPDTKFMKTNAKSESSGINHKAQTYTVFIRNKMREINSRILQKSV